jgi:DNA-binding response OmpR family regulator
MNYDSAVPGDDALPRLRVVVADDDRDEVLSLSALLREDGHEVRGVANGRQALKAVSEFGADVLLLDIGMPGLSGYEVARALRDRYGGARPTLIAVTGRTAPVDQTLLSMTGFDLYVAKPYDPRVLLGIVASIRKLSACARG